MSRFSKSPTATLRAPPAHQRVRLPFDLCVNDPNLSVNLAWQAPCSIGEDSCLLTYILLLDARVYRSLWNGSAKCIKKLLVMKEKNLQSSIKNFGPTIEDLVLSV